MSYSLGQVICKTKSGPSGSAAEGVQHPFEISVINMVKDPETDMEISVFPNPAKEHLILQIADGKSAGYPWSYYLYDLHGRVLMQQDIAGDETPIELTLLNASAYILRIVNKEKCIKTFKII